MPMSNIDKIRKATDDIKHDAIANDSNKMEEYILKILTEYYYSYVNDDMDAFQTSADQLQDIITVASGQYNNVDGYINYCKVLILTSIMNTAFKRDESLDTHTDIVFRGKSISCWSITCT